MVRANLVFWLRRFLILPAAVLGFVLPIMLPSFLSHFGLEANAVPDVLQRMVLALVYGLAAFLVVMLSAWLEPKEKFAVAALFYAMGTLLVLVALMAFGVRSFDLGLSVMALPLLVGFLCVRFVHKRFGYGCVAAYLENPDMTRNARIWLWARRTLLLLLLPAVVMVPSRVSGAIENAIYKACPAEDYQAPVESVREDCFNSTFQRYLQLNAYAATAVAAAMVIFWAALMEPQYKRLAALFIWLSMTGLLLVLSLFFWRHTLLAFVVAGLCVLLIWRLLPPRPERAKTPAVLG